MMNSQFALIWERKRVPLSRVDVMRRRTTQFKSVTTKPVIETISVLGLSELGITSFIDIVCTLSRSLNTSFMSHAQAKVVTLMISPRGTGQSRGDRTLL